MPTETQHINLTSMRESVGLTVRELARQLNTNHTNVINWEKAGWITKTEFVAPLSSILGVTIEELLALPKPRRNSAPGGKLGQAFRQVAELPRNQQQRILATIEDMLIAQQSKAAS